MTYVSKIAKHEVASELSELESAIQNSISKDSILFVKAGAASEKQEIYTMLFALQHNITTLNGYSGCYIDGFDNYDYDYPEARRRLLLYMKDNNLLHNKAFYDALIQRVVPIGFKDTSTLPMTSAQYTLTHRRYSEDDIKKLRFDTASVRKIGHTYSLDINLKNTSDSHFSAFSACGNHLRIACRFLDKEKNVLTDWFMRKSLYTDIQPYGSSDVSITFKKSNTFAQFIEVSLVQEHQFWAHDIGFKTLTLPFE